MNRFAASAVVLSIAVASCTGGTSNGPRASSASETAAVVSASSTPPGPEPNGSFPSPKPELATSMELSYYSGSCSRICSGMLRLETLTNRLGTPRRTLWVDVRLGRLPSGPQAYRHIRGKLTRSGTIRAIRLLRRLVQARVLWHYPGCGAPCDGVDVTLRVGPFQTVYGEGELGSVGPPILRAVDRMGFGLFRALEECKQTEIIVPQRGCVPVEL